MKRENLFGSKTLYCIALLLVFGHAQAATQLEYDRSLDEPLTMSLSEAQAKMSPLAVGNSIVRNDDRVNNLSTEKFELLYDGVRIENLNVVVRGADKEPFLVTEIVPPSEFPPAPELRLGDSKAM